MTHTWFTDYDGPWNPRLAREHFTTGDDRTQPHTYGAVIRKIRNWFFLEKTNKVGIERGTGVPRIYKDLKIQVYVDEFKWGDFVQVDGDWQPVLQLKMRIFTLPVTALRRVIPPKQLLNYWVEIRFDPAWPIKPPHIRIDDPRYTNFHGAMHDHHMYRNGWVCFFADSNDWTRRDTVISFVQAFIDWAMWHHKKFGW